MEVGWWHMLYLQWVRQNLEQNPGELCKTGGIPLSLAVLGYPTVPGYPGAGIHGGEHLRVGLRATGRDDICRA